jgi:hypothetical protein
MNLKFQLYNYLVLRPETGATLKEIKKDLNTNSQYFHKAKQDIAKDPNLLPISGAWEGEDNCKRFVYRITDSNLLHSLHVQRRVSDTISKAQTDNQNFAKYYRQVTPTSALGKKLRRYFETLRVMLDEIDS